MIWVVFFSPEIRPADAVFTLGKRLGKIFFCRLYNLSAFVGLAAMVLLYYLYKNYQDDRTEKANREDPFKKFEREWEELSKK